MGDDSKDALAPDQPVAYDAEGKPLYAAPVVTEEKSTPDDTSQEFEKDAATQQKHLESVAQFPDLNLSEDEFIISVIHRHPIGLFVPMSLTVGLIALIMAGLWYYPTLLEGDLSFSLPGVVPMTVLALLVIILIGLFGYAAMWIFLKNCLYLTNHSLIQEVRLGLFSKREQTISLGKIKDASFRQVGILQMTLDYGSIRLSTIGDETWYRLQFVSNPKQQLALVHNAVEAFKEDYRADLMR